MNAYNLTTRVAILERDNDRHDHMLSTVVEDVEILRTDMAVVKRDVASSARVGAFMGGLLASMVASLVAGLLVFFLTH